MRLVLVMIIGLSAIIAAGCKTTADAPAEETQTEERAAMQIVDGIEGRVVHMDLEGGFYGIQTEAGDKYMPINLADEYKVDGLAIVFKVKPRPDVMTITMWGTTVEITEITRK